MDDRLVPVIGIFALAAFGFLFYVVHRAGKARRAAQLEADRKAQEQYIQDGVGLGILAEDPLTGEVYPRCIVCGDRATAYAPISGVSWMDKLPLLSRLHSLAPRYVIELNIDGGVQMCKLHRQVAIKRLEEFHALLRAERAKFNALQEDKVAQMDGGALVCLLQESHKVAVASIRPPETKQLLASTATPSPVTIVSSGRKVGAEEPEDVA